MLIKKTTEIASSEITSREQYWNRREFIKHAGLAGTGTLAVHGTSGLSAVTGKLQVVKSSLSTQGEKLTSLKDITSYNNFYELGTGKEDPARNSGSLHPMPWTIMVEGEIKRPKATFDVESIIRMHPSLEERVYRMRCVEAWSMVIPWIGIPLATVIKKLEPTSKARYVVFETLYDPRQMPGQRLSTLPWPYVEALRIDEASHPLTILAVGLYGETLPVQDGAPIRLVVPWKYGFKSIKSIVKLKFVASRPATTWNVAAPQEYGFYANVNPDVDHPRWSQANERRIGESGARKTLLFNGYADQVAPLYSGMDLRKDF